MRLSAVPAATIPCCQHGLGSTDSKILHLSSPARCHLRWGALIAACSNLSPDHPHAAAGTQLQTALCTCVHYSSGRPILTNTACPTSWQAAWTLPWPAAAEQASQPLSESTALSLHRSGYALHLPGTWSPGSPQHRPCNLPHPSPMGCCVWQPASAPCRGQIAAEVLGRFGLGRAVWGMQVSHAGVCRPLSRIIQKAKCSGRCYLREELRPVLCC